MCNKAASLLLEVAVVLNLAAQFNHLLPRGAKRFKEFSRLGSVFGF